MENDNNLSAMEPLISYELFEKMSKTAHEVAKAKGWWDDVTDMDYHLKRAKLLVYSELFEAFEATRNDNYANPAQLKYAMSNDVEYFQTYFRVNIKDTFEDELADTVVRIWDISGYLFDKTTGHTRQTFKPNKGFISKKPFALENFTFVEILDYLRGRSYNPWEILYYIERISQLRKFDIGTHILTKMKYNEGRKHKHGKSF